MRVAKWGNSLAVRLPASLVEELNLKEGDDINIRAAKNGGFDAARDLSKEDAFKRIRELRRPLPAGYKFDRVEANERR
jgi:antitoxin MazE